MDALATKPGKQGVEVVLDFGREWRASAVVAPGASGPRVVALSIEATEGAQEPNLTFADLRLVPLKALREAGLKLLLDKQRDETAAFDRRGPRLLARTGAPVTTSQGYHDLLAVLERPNPRRGGRPTVFYARVAECYVRLVAESPDRPLERLSEALGIKPTTARNYLQKARSQDLLTAARAGKPGGRLTEKAESLLREHHLPDVSE